jgi:hypothetical protein
VLAISNLVLATGLVLLGVAQGFATLALAWAVLGVGMAMGLYDPAFATLTGLYGRAARGPITGITLIAGFASTVGWPLSAFLDAEFGWRMACLIWAALHIVIGLPLNRLLIPRAPPPARASEVAGETSPAPRGARLSLLSCLRRPGLSPVPWLRICRASSKWPARARRRRLRPLGPAQVAARLVEFGALRMVHPLVSARLIVPHGRYLLPHEGVPQGLAATYTCSGISLPRLSARSAPGSAPRRRESPVEEESTQRIVD